MFLDGSAADTLDDKVLDASVDPQGAVEFTVIPQAGMPSPNGQRPPSWAVSRPTAGPDKPVAVDNGRLV